MAKKRIVTFLGPNKGLSIAGDHAYAYSGSHAATAAGHTTMLEFVTGESYIVANFTFGNTSASGDHIEFEIQINGKVVMACIGDAIGESFPLNSFQLILPSYSKVTVTTVNASGGADRNVFASISGRVYDA